MGINFKKNGTYFTLENLIRVLAVFLFINVFLPVEKISAMGMSQKWSTFDLTFGAGDMDEVHIIFILCILLPLAILALSFLDQFVDGFGNYKVISLLGCSGVDFILLIIAKAHVDGDGMTLSATLWYEFSILFLVVIIAVTVLALLKKVTLDFDLGIIPKAFKYVKENSAKVPEQAPETQEAQSVQAVFCPNCGAQLEAGAEFCGECGTKLG